MISVGERAPSLELSLDDGRVLDPSKPGGPLVLFFFPRAFTPICTREACGFRDAMPDLEPALVVGVSGDPAERHREFRNAYQLPYPMASDPGGNVAKAFGATFLGTYQRATFVIDAEGVVRAAYSNAFAPAAHAKTARKALDSLG